MLLVELSCGRTLRQVCEALGLDVGSYEARQLAGQVLALGRRQEGGGPALIGLAADCLQVGTQLQPG